MMNIKYSGLILVFFFLFLACNSNFTPKPRGYFKIDFPEHQYQQFIQADFPYTFEYPTYATITKEYDSTGQNPYWINIDFPGYAGRIYISYKGINSSTTYKIKTSTGYKDSVVRNSFDLLREEAYKMTYKHSIKASGIVDSFFVNPQGSSGVYFYVGGEAATSKQFYLTDTTKHFLRGALYFDASPNSDSISVVSDFLDKDIKHLIHTLKWQN
jgi:gliding motility-associated lipoprotein GldD